MNALQGVIDMRLIEGIRSLNADGQPDLLAELVGILKDTTPAILDALESAVESGDERVTQRLAHRLKGGSGNVGARRMARLCSDFEQAVKEGSADAASQKRTVEAIRQAYGEALLALDQLI